MPTPSGNPISMADINNELSFNDATTRSINDEGVRKLKNEGVSAATSGASLSLNDLKNKNAFKLPLVGASNWPGPWGSSSVTHSTFAQAGVAIRIRVQDTNDRVECDLSTFNSTAAQTFNNHPMNHTGDITDSNGTWQINVTWSLSTSGSGSSNHPSSSDNGAWVTLSDSTYKYYTWSETASSGTRFSVGSATVKFRYFDTIDGATRYWPSSSGLATSQITLSISATKGTSGGPGGPE